MTPEEILEDFLKDLGELCKAHGVSIDGCGCCWSPWVEYVDEEGNGHFVEEVNAKSDGRVLRNKGVTFVSKERMIKH